MEIVVHYHGLNARPLWKTLAEAQLGKLQSLASIARAQITFMWQHGVKPAFRVAALLEVPGPDFHAEASDHTLQAALLKVVNDLEHQIRARTNRRLNKTKTNLQLGRSEFHSGSGFAAAKV